MILVLVFRLIRLKDGVRPSYLMRQKMINIDVFIASICTIVSKEL